jgi:hypothetical protein
MNAREVSVNIDHTIIIETIVMVGIENPSVVIATVEIHIERKKCRRPNITAASEVQLLAAAEEKEGSRNSFLAKESRLWGRITVKLPRTCTNSNSSTVKEIRTCTNSNSSTVKETRTCTNSNTAHSHRRTAAATTTAYCSNLMETQVCTRHRSVALFEATPLVGRMTMKF